MERLEGNGRSRADGPTEAGGNGEEMEGGGGRQGGIPILDGGKEGAPSLESGRITRAPGGDKGPPDARMHLKPDFGKAESLMLCFRLTNPQVLKTQLDVFGAPIHQSSARPKRPENWTRGFP